MGFFDKIKKKEEIVLNFDAPLEWTVPEVGHWVKHVLGFPKYKNMFIKNEISGKILSKLTDEQLKEDFRISVVGHRITILEEIKSLTRNRSRRTHVTLPSNSSGHHPVQASPLNSPSTDKTKIGVSSSGSHPVINPSSGNDHPRLNIPSHTPPSSLNKYAPNNSNSANLTLSGNRIHTNMEAHSRAGSSSATTLTVTPNTPAADRASSGSSSSRTPSSPSSNRPGGVEFAFQDEAQGHDTNEVQQLQFDGDRAIYLLGIPEIVNEKYLTTYFTKLCGPIQKKADGTPMVHLYRNVCSGTMVFEKVESCSAALEITSLGKEAGNQKIVVKRCSDIIRSKIMKNSTLNKFDEKQVDELILGLSTPNRLKSTFLSTEWIETVALFRRTVSNISSENTSGETDPGSIKLRKLNPLVSQPASGELIGFVGQQEEEDEDEDETNIEDDSVFNPNSKVYDKNARIKIKLVVSEIMKGSLKKNVRKLLSPIMANYDVLPQFGAFHTALIVGPWLIEWNNSSLCIPRKTMSTAALLTADVEDILITRENIGNVVDKLADVIIEWNLNKEYVNVHNSNNHKSGNCQDFVEEVLHRLGIEPKFEGLLGQYLSEMRRHGKCEMVVKLDDKFKEKFKRNETDVYFETHKELDQFVNSLIDIDPEFNEHHKNEWILLKSFDRAFWLRHYKDMSNTIYQSDTHCPFEDPKNTLSYGGYSGKLRR